MSGRIQTMMIGDEIAADPMTTRDIAETVLAAANITKPDKVALADLIGTINSSLQKKGV
jgi:hypothetical protein